MATRLVAAGRVVRARATRPGQPRTRPRWIVHLDTCLWAPGCAPLDVLVTEFGERGVLGRLRAGLLIRCPTCNPLIVDRTEEPC